MDVGEWLLGLGFGQYEALFRGNNIDTNVLSELTESDLSSWACPLGIASAYSKR